MGRVGAGLNGPRRRRSARQRLRHRDWSRSGTECVWGEACCSIYARSLNEHRRFSPLRSRRCPVHTPTSHSRSPVRRLVFFGCITIHASPALLTITNQECNAYALSAVKLPRQDASAALGAGAAKRACRNPPTGPSCPRAPRVWAGAPTSQCPRPSSPCPAYPASHGT